MMKKNKRFIEYYVTDLAYFIADFKILGVDPTDFYGYNLIDEFEKYLSITDYPEDFYTTNILYTYCKIADIANELGFGDLVKAHIDYVLQYYVFGKGFCYPEYKPEPNNNGIYRGSYTEIPSLLMGLAPFQDEYAEYIEDASAVLQTYYTEKGYCGDDTYGTDGDYNHRPFIAYSMLGDKEKADAAFKAMVYAEIDENHGYFCGLDEEGYTLNSEFLNGAYYYLKNFDSYTSLVDEKSGITVTGNIEEGAQLNVIAKETTANKLVYDIALLKDGKTIQPNGKVTVKIPVAAELGKNAKVYREEADGKLTDMKAVYADGYMTFKTDHFSVYVIKSDKSVEETANNKETTKPDSNKKSPNTGVSTIALAILCATGAGAVLIKKKNEF